MGERPWRAWQDWTKGRRALEMCWSKARRDAGRVVSNECERERKRERKKVCEREFVSSECHCRSKREEIRKRFFSCIVSSSSTTSTSS
jgi:hypothetical protein